MVWGSMKKKRRLKQNRLASARGVRLHHYQEEKITEISKQQGIKRNEVIRMALDFYFAHGIQEGSQAA